MQEQTPELEALLNAVHDVTVGITPRTCPMYSKVCNTYGSTFCTDICLFKDKDGYCKIRLLDKAYGQYLSKAREVKPYIPGNPDCADPLEELEILDATEVCI
jgi:hypothetical protein